MSEGRDTWTGLDGTTERRTTAVYDWGEVDPTTAVIETLDCLLDGDPAQTLPLYESVDPDALDALLTHAGASAHATPLSVCFEFNGHLVTVYDSGEVVVKPQQAYD